MPAMRRRLRARSMRASFFPLWAVGLATSRCIPPDATSACEGWVRSALLPFHSGNPEGLMHRFALVLLAACATAATKPESAGTETFQATLDSASEVPAP